MGRSRLTTSSDDGWTEVRVDVALPPAARDATAQELYLEPLCEAARVVSPDGVLLEGPDAPPGERSPVAAGHVRLTVYVPTATEEADVGRLAGLLADYPNAELATRPLDPGWKEHWKRWFRGFDVSPRLRIRPPWEPSRGGAEVIIEPGLAFGTGQHETTRLCLELLDELATDEGLTEVLDVGCGTGVLAIAACMLGAASAVGVDNDPLAIRTAHENAELNRVGARATFSEAPVETLGTRFPLVVANIRTDVLIGLAGTLWQRTSPGGRLALSGVLTEEEGRVEQQFRTRGFVLIGKKRRAHWSLAVLRRPREAQP